MWKYVELTDRKVTGQDFIFYETLFILFFFSFYSKKIDKMH